MLTCKQCGGDRQEGDKFCPICGQDFTREAAEAAEQPTTPQSGADADALSAPAPDAFAADSTREAGLGQVSADGTTAPESDGWDGAPGGGEDAVVEDANQPAGPQFCHNCGTRLAAGSSFCASCGVKLPQPVPAEEMIPVSQPYYSASDDFYAEEAAPARKKPGKGAIVAICAVAVVILGLVGVLVTQLIPRQAAKTPLAEMPLVYVQEDSTLKYIHSEMDGAETITGSFDVQSDYLWESSYLAMTSGDGRYILYLNDYRTRDYGSGRGDLYLRDVSAPTEEGQPTDKGIKISSDVTIDYYFSMDDNYVFYIDYSGDLYAWDFSESYRLDSDVTGIYDYNEDHVIYYKGERWGSSYSSYSGHDIYIASLEKGGRDDRLKIDSDIAAMLDWTEDFGQFMYTKNASRGDDDEMLYDLYHYDAPSDTREKLLTDIGDVMDAQVAEKSAVYLTPRATALGIEDLVDDDMVGLDDDVEDPDFSQFTLLEELMEDLFYYGYDLSWLFGYSGSSYGYGYGMYEYFSTSEILSMLEEYIDYYAEYYDYDPVAAKAELAELKEYIKDYEAIALRNELRKKIEDELEYQMSYNEMQVYDMHLYRNGERQKLDSNVFKGMYSYYPAYVDMEQGYAIYIKRDFNALKKMKMSEITESGYSFSFDLEEYLQAQLPGELYVVLLEGGDPTLLGTEDEKSSISLYDATFAPDGSGIYYMQEHSGYTANGADLYFCPIENGEIGKAQLVDENVNYFMSYDVYQGKMLYLKNHKADKCDLYAVSGTDTERLCYDISYQAFSGTMYDNEETLFFFENYNGGSESGDMYIFTDEKTLVSEDVYAFYYRDDDLIYVLKDYRAGKGDLYVYDGESLRIVDYDVTHVLEYEW